MKNWISFLLLIPMCLSLMISGVAEPSPADITTPTEEITLTTTESTTETTVQEVTEATIGTTEATEGEDIDSDEWFVTDDPNYIPPSKQPTDVTEPAATEPEKQEPELISLGRSIVLPSAISEYQTLPPEFVPSGFLPIAFHC